jgi:hypothetical protein
LVHRVDRFLLGESQELLVYRACENLLALAFGLRDLLLQNLHFGRAWLELLQ